MTSKKWTLFVLALLLLLTSTSASGTTRRFVLAAGVNSGGQERVPLRYAVSDAAQFSDVMTEMGGVETADRLILNEPSLREFRDALTRMREYVSTSPDSIRRTEVLFYYSGHADEEGLLLGEERFPYNSLRQMMDQVPADVRITVLDACASGAITRIKGGQRRQAFLVDDSSEMKGYAFLTSSSADEAAQESDQIGSSFFTHYLVSGMRGAADASGDGKVSLTEAYEFAFHETLASTTETRGGAQHPAYEINLSGTGDVVMTDLREISAGLVLTEELSGRFFVRNASRQLVAELFKPEGRLVELGLEPGKYSIYMAQEDALFLGSTNLETGDRLILQQGDFRTLDREETVLRGARPGGYSASIADLNLRALARRTRFEMKMGAWSHGPRNEELESDGTVRAKVTSASFLVGFGISRWLTDNTAIGLDVDVVAATVDAAVGTEVRADEVSITSVMLNGRRYLPWDSPATTLLPYVSGGVGTFIASKTESIVGSEVVTSVKVMSAPGVRIGAGVDVPLSRRWMLGTDVGYHIVGDFEDAVGGRKNYRGFSMRIGLSLLLGKGIHLES